MIDRLKTMLGGKKSDPAMPSDAVLAMELQAVIKKHIGSGKMPVSHVLSGVASAAGAAVLAVAADRQTANAFMGIIVGRMMETVTSIRLPEMSEASADAAAPGASPDLVEAPANDDATVSADAVAPKPRRPKRSGKKPSRKPAKQKLRKSA